MSLTKAIEKINTELPIECLISKYIEIKERGKGFNGHCPLCKSNTGFTLSPQKNIFKCFFCSAGGNPIKFIMAYKQLAFKEAVQFLLSNYGKTLNITEEVSKTSRLVTGTVYVMELKEDCYFIGFSTSPEKSIKDNFDGKDLLWTRRHQLIKVLKSFPEKTIEYTDELTERAIAKFGYQNVRGGDLIYFEQKYGKKIKGEYGKFLKLKMKRLINRTKTPRQTSLS